MTYYAVWMISSVEDALDQLPRDERDSFDVARAALQNDPYPRRDGDLIWVNTRVQQQFYSYYDGRFPFIIRYIVEDHPTARMAVVWIFALHGFTLPGDPVTLAERE